MSVPLTCFDNIIGLSRTECECYPEVSSTASLSNIYLDELEPLSKISDNLDCDKGKDLWLYLDRARDTAITTFLADANAMLLKYYRVKRQPYIGSIGRATKKSLLTLTSGNYYGVRLHLADVVSGEFKVTNIGGVFGSTGAINILVYNNLNEHIGTYPINVTAGQHSRNTVDITLPTHNAYVDNLEYFFIYQLGSITPYNNDIKCNCGKFKPYFDTNRPYFYTQTDGYGWANYAMVGGFASSDISDLSELSATTNNLMYGLTLDVEFRCRVNEVFCRDSMDFVANPLALAIAFAIRYKAGEILLHDILRSTKINRATLVDADQAKEDINFFSQRYTDMLTYIIDSINIKGNDCFECKDIVDMTKRGILA